MITSRGFISVRRSLCKDLVISRPLHVWHFPTTAIILQQLSEFYRVLAQSQCFMRVQSAECSEVERLEEGEDPVFGQRTRRRLAGDVCG